jgi:hypothetical protein
LPGGHRLRAPGVLSEFATRSEFLARRSTARIGLSNPAVPLAFSPAVRFSVRRAAPATVKRLTRPLFEFRVPPEFSTASPSRPAAADQRLSWASGSLQHIQGTEVHLPQALPRARYGPPAGFGYPHGGLRPPSPGRACFIPAALVGFALRSFLLTEGTRRVSARVNPLAVSPVGNPAARGGGPAQRAAASGLSPFRESLATGGG